MSEVQVPGIPENLLKWLDMLYPAACPALETPDRNIWFNAGARSVVVKLQQHYDRQQRDAKERQDVFK